MNPHVREISKLTEPIPFKVSTSIKSIIGRELVTNPSIAIFELVKNSYDAFAPQAWIIFKDVKGGQDPRLVVVDDGIGMSKRDLVDKWLFVGYSDKRDETRPKKRPRGPLGKRKRLFAGAKGIGRFSCDTLGKQLVLLSKQKGKEVVHRLEVDWTRFERDQEEQFQNMKAAYSRDQGTVIEGFDLRKMGAGTILEIRQLRDTWDVKKLRVLTRYLQRLVNPTAIGSQSQEFVIEVRAEEFKDDDAEARTSPKSGPVINGRVQNFIFEKLGIKTTYVHSKIEDGKIFTSLTDKDKLVFELSEKNVYPQLDNVEARVFFLNRAAKATFKSAMGMNPKEYGSVFLYRNEFRIHPYGDDGDDWLQIEERKGQGYKRYLSKRDMIGAVVLRGPQKMFREVSSRDGGVIRTEAFFNLTNYLKAKVIRRLERYVEGVIRFDMAAVQGSEDRRDIEAKSLELVSRLVEGTKGPGTTIKVGPDLLQTLDESLTSRYPTILKNLMMLREHVRGTKEQEMLETAIAGVKRTLAKAEAEKNKLANSLAAKEQEVQYLSRTLSPENESLLGHLHWIKISSGLIEDDLTKLRSWAMQPGAPVEALEAIEDCSIQVKKILNLSKMATSANFDLEKEEIEGDIVSYVTQYLQRFGVSRKDVLGPTQFFGENLKFISVFRPISLAIVLDNLLNNSRKNGASAVSIKFEKAGSELHILFGDDGRGISNEEARHIFEMGFSTTGGTGLGLHQVKKIIEDFGGRIRFLGNDKKGLGSGACFEVVIR
jgi:signal transduction histidine kinase